MTEEQSRRRHPSNDRTIGRMPSTVTDLRYGRRGGGWLPPNYTEHREDQHCPVCDQPLTCGQDVHQSCVAPVLTLFDQDE